MLNASWVEPDAAEYLAPNCTAEAARDFGIEDDRVWLALIKAELLEGKKTGRWEVAAEVGAQAAGARPAIPYIERAKSPEIEARVRKSTAEFHALQVTQRPTFVIDTPIGDRAVFSGFAKVAPMAATLDAMLRRHCWISRRTPPISVIRPREILRRIRLQIVRPLRNALPVYRCRIQLPLGSGHTANRSSAPRRREDFRVRRAPEWRDGRLR